MLNDLAQSPTTIGELRAFLYRAADALDAWGGTAEAVNFRTTAELLGSPDVVRRLRFEALVKTAREWEAIGR